MMSKEKRRVPKLRFPGFTEDWEQRKLSEVVTINPKTELPDKFKYVDLESVVGTNLLGFQVIKKENAPSRAQRLASYGDVFYQTVRPYQRNNYLFENIDKDMVFSTGYAQLRSKLDSYFLLTLVQNDNFVKVVLDNCTGTSYPAINGSELGKITVQIPSNGAEANQIGKVFRGIDNIITLHQRKLNNLKLKKKALLQKLFPKNGERYPELRFSGFTDAWEQRKLSQITVRVTRKNGNQSDLPLTISAQDGLVDQRKYFNRQVASRDMSNYYLIKKGEFAYNKSYSEGYPFGAVKRLEYYDIGALSTLYILFEITDKNISSDFLVSYYMTHLWYKEVSKRAAEGARNHGLLNISTEDFFNSELNIPNSIEEQVKIGNLIKQFDKFITLHQRKLDHLQLQKKALLQQMFV